MADPNHYTLCTSCRCMLAYSLHLPTDRWPAGSVNLDSSKKLKIDRDSWLNNKMV